VGSNPALAAVNANGRFSLLYAKNQAALIGGRRLRNYGKRSKVLGVVW